MNENAKDETSSLNYFQPLRDYVTTTLQPIIVQVKLKTNIERSASTNPTKTRFQSKWSNEI